MPKFKVTQTDCVCYVYEVEAIDQDEAEQKVLADEAEHLPEYDEVVDRNFEFEDITERYPNRDYRVKED